MKTRPTKTDIRELLLATTDEVLDFATDELVKYYPKESKEKARVYFHDDDFVYAIGDSPICLVAHVDTVRDRQSSGTRASVSGEKPVVLLQNRNVITNANGILGADDRAGVFACLDLVRKCSRAKLPMPSVILTNGEESGGLGAKKFVKCGVFSDKDKGTKLFVEMDRCNSIDWVSYGGTLPRPVVEYIESFGFRSSSGSYSDIREFQDAYSIPSVNLSIGYYAQHTDRESLHVDEMYMTINRVLNMLRDPITELHKVEKPTYTYYGSSHYSRKDNGGQKNESTGKEKDGGSFSFPNGKEGDEYIDKVLDKMTWGGYCRECGHEWVDCTCGELLVKILTYLEESEIEVLMKCYLKEHDPLYEELDLFLKESKAEEEKTSSTETQVTTETETLPLLPEKCTANVGQ